MPLIEISLANGDLVRFSNTRIINQFTELEVGDHISKEKNSKSCAVNKINVVCIK